jgi:Cystatin domain
MRRGTLLMLGALLSGCAQSGGEAVNAGAQGQAQPEHHITGGWSEASASPHLRAAADFAVAQLGRKGARLRSIDRAQTQVVAGTNVQMDLSLEDGSRWAVTVWQKLDGTMELTSASPL